MSNFSGLSAFHGCKYVFIPENNLGLEASHLDTMVGASVFLIPREAGDEELTGLSNELT